MTRIDHTNCLHPRGAFERKHCRADRQAAIKACQVRYMEVADDLNFAGQREYEAMVELLSYRLGVDLLDAYQIVENGPVMI